MSSARQRRLKFFSPLYFPEWARLSSLSTKIVPAWKSSVIPWRLGVGEGDPELREEKFSLFFFFF